VIALPREKTRNDRAVDAARHGDHHPRITRFLVKIETVHWYPRHSTAFKAPIKRLQNVRSGPLLYRVCGVPQQDVPGRCSTLAQPAIRLVPKLTKTLPGP